jgi:hypothetical protein
VGDDRLDRQNTPGQKKQQDRNRDITVYKYLIRLTDGYEYLQNEQSVKKGSSPNEQPVEKASSPSIASQWGTDKMFVQRVMWNLYPEIYSDNSATKNVGLPYLGIDKLVDILISLREYWSSKQDGKIQKLDIIKVLRLFCQTTPEQEEDLGLYANQSKVLLQRLEDSINNLSPDSIPKVITKLYDYFLSVKVESPDREILDKADEYKLIEKYLFSRLKSERNDSEKILIQTTHSKIKVEESKIKIENGSNRYEFYNPDRSESSCLPASTMDILIKSVVENEKTTNKIPIYFKYIEIKKNRSLPLYLDENDNFTLEENDTNSRLGNNKRSEKTKIGVLDYQLHKDCDNDSRKEVESFSSIDSLKNLFSHTVKVHFYIKLKKEDNNSNYIENKDTNLNVDLHRDGSQVIVNFFEEVSGVGSVLSHVTAAINRVLLWDIPSLDKYIPIAKNIIVRGEHLGSSPNSTIWGHNVVCLCKRVDVNASIAKKKIYDRMFNTQEYACGDYCGSDILEVLAKSAFYARLRAIEQIGIDPDRYIDECLTRIREVNALRKAKSLLNDYPFSLLAMGEYIENNIFKQPGGEVKYRKLNEENHDINFEPSTEETRWSMVAYESHLMIAEATLKEGLFVRGKKYLDVLKKHIEKHENNIDSLFIAKYYLSQFRYEYLVSKGSVDPLKSALKKSKEYLAKYVNKCHIIDELPQVNFHDFFHISSRICAHEAKINLFLLRPTDADKRREYISQAIYSFEKARIYAARDGSVSMYSMWSAYQSWCYMIEAYLLDENTDKNADPNSDILAMADVRLDHALVCYAENGRKCYEAIKTNSGKLRSHEPYDNIDIQVIPLIRERTKDDPAPEQPAFDSDEDILTLDMSILSWEYPLQYGRGNVKTTYLFGMPSTILLFALGMRSLCKRNYDSPQEFSEAIEKSAKFFNYSWSVAEEGLEKCSSGQKDRVTYRRRFPTTEDLKTIDEMAVDLKTINEMAVIGLYPRRVTKFADLGKIFSIVCYLILICDRSNTEDEKIKINRKIDFMIKEMDNNKKFNDKDKVLGQDEYNSHFLKEVRECFKKYTKKWRSKVPQIMSSEQDNMGILKTRNKIIRDVFLIITTQFDPSVDLDR